MDQPVDTGDVKVDTEVKAEVSMDVKVEIVVIDVTENKKEEIESGDIDYTKYEEKSLGRLKRTLSEKCSSCNHVLQLRTRKIKSLLRGETIQEEEDYKYCSNCREEFEIREQKKRKTTDGFDKTAIRKEDLVVENDRKSRRDNNGRHFQRSTVTTRTRTDNRKSFRNSK